MELISLRRHLSTALRDLARGMPRPFDGVSGLTDAGSHDGCDGRFEGVRFAGEVAFAFVVDCGDETATRDVRGFGELNVGGAVPDSVDAEAGEGEEIFDGGPGGRGVGEHSVADLLHDDRASYW